jgi:hypothetical protein
MKRTAWSAESFHQFLLDARTSAMPSRRRWHYNRPLPRRAPWRDIGDDLINDRDAPRKDAELLSYLDEHLAWTAHDGEPNVARSAWYRYRAARRKQAQRGGAA